MKHISEFLTQIIYKMTPTEPVGNTDLLEKSAFKAGLVRTGQWTTKDDARILYESIRPMFDESVDFRVYCAFSGHLNIPICDESAKVWLESPEASTIDP
jgi:hypothetical protein